MSFKVGQKFKDDEGDEFTIIAIGKEDFAVEYGDSLNFTILGLNLDTMNKYSLNTEETGNYGENYGEMEF
jgi:hypothetical protein